MNKKDQDQDKKNAQSNTSHHHQHKDQGHHNHHDHHAHMIKDFIRRFWVSMVMTLPIVLLAPLIQDLLGFKLTFTGDHLVQWGLSSLIFIYGGWPFLKGMRDEIAQKSPGMMTLIALAILVAYGYSSAVVFGLQGKMFFWELATLIDIMLLGHWLEMKSVMGASNALEELAELMPSSARRIKSDGEMEDVPLSELKAGDRLVIRSGEKIPADGVVQEGESSINESLITGESRPVSKASNDQVIGGAINGSGSLTIEVSHGADDSYLNQVIDLVEKAQKNKSKTQNFANKAAGWLFYLALSAGIITLVVWLSLGKEFDYALERMVTVMIISCPHALGLAIPLVVANSTTIAAKNGLLIRNRTAFENAGQITTLIFDKTGTLTQGNFGLSRFKSLSDSFSDEEVLRLAASVENYSEHPIASGVVSKAHDLDLDLTEAYDVQGLTARGVRGQVEQQSIMLLSPGGAMDEGFKIPEEASSSGEETVIFLVVQDKLVGFIALSDQIRPESQEAISLLKKKGIKVYMATGDNKKVAEEVSKKLGLDNFYAEVKPEDKQDIIKELQGKGEFVAMTGDGVNDAPALAQANIGIAVGSGTDVAAETADIVLVNSNPKDIAKVILFGGATYRKMMQNLWWAAGYNIVAVPLAAGVLASVNFILSPAVGAALMSLSTIIVAINAQLLQRKINPQ